MKTAYLYLRHTHDKRYEIFSAGLKKHGYRIESGLPADFRETDVFVTWNRLSAANRVAESFERAGCTVLVAENATWGNDFCGNRWFHIARNFHNKKQCFPVGDSERWDSLGAELGPFRDRAETVILPQRGIGSDPVRMPQWWPRKALKKYGGRIRRHPGKREAIPLEEDLKNCGHVVTWGSGAAVKALMMGIKVTSEMPGWIAEQDNTEEGRLAMFRRLAWAQWRYSEIENGFAFERLL